MSGRLHKPVDIHLMLAAAEATLRGRGEASLTAHGATEVPPVHLEDTQ